MVDKWIPIKVAERIEEAASTLRRLQVSGLKPREYGNTWPTVIHDVVAVSATIIRPPPPAADAITRMDETMTWLQWLEPDQIRLVWLRAERMPWKDIMRQFGFGRTTAWTHWMASLMQITSHLNAQKRCSNIVSEHLSSEHSEQNLL